MCPGLPHEFWSDAVAAIAEHPLLDSSTVLAALVGRLESHYGATADGACDPACIVREAQLAVEAYRMGGGRTGPGD